MEGIFLLPGHAGQEEGGAGHHDAQQGYPPRPGSDDVMMEEGVKGVSMEGWRWISYCSTCW